MMLENLVNHERSQHIDTRIYFIRDLVKDGVMQLVKVAGVEKGPRACSSLLSGEAQQVPLGHGSPFHDLPYWVTVKGWDCASCGSSRGLDLRG
eukprot:47440-Rhodomonas_salina.1